MLAFQLSQRAFLQASVVMEYGSSLYAVDDNFMFLETAEVVGLLEVYKCNVWQKVVVTSWNQQYPFLKFIEKVMK